MTSKLTKDSGAAHIEADDVESLVSRLRTTRSRLEECLHPADEERSYYDGGWQVAPYDPNSLLAACEHIRLRDGFQLASYQLIAGANGNGFTLVIPKDRALPDPQGNIDMRWDGPTPVFRIADMNAPDWIHRDVSEFLEGDKSMLSYFEASLCSRELRELGAMWHGCSWSTHEVLASPKVCDPEVWTWHESEPKEWRPLVARVTSRTVRVEFFTFSELGEQHIVKHTDAFTRGYRFKTKQTTLGTGGPGYIF